MFLIQGAALGMWLVPLSTVLDAYGFHAIKAYAYATSAVAAFISPLIFGAMADRHASPVKVLRGLAIATSIAMTLASTSIHLHAPAWLVLALIQLHALCSAPTWSISSSIVLARIQDPKQEFGPIRAMATVGWMGGCWIVSVLGADATTMSGYTGAAMWVVVALFTFLLPKVEAAPQGSAHSLRERLGLDALSLLKDPNHRVVFITVALFAIPISGFYPYTPPQLRELGMTHTSAWMTLGQITEVIAMGLLGRLLLNWRLKWIFAAGLASGVIRFALSAVHGPVWLLAGVLLHGSSYTLVFITAQIYLDQRVDPSWRSRAQALMTLLSSGVGNLSGYLAVGFWFNYCSRSTTGTEWTLFWSMLSVASALVLTYFLKAYRGTHARSPEPK